MPASPLAFAAFALLFAAQLCAFAPAQRRFAWPLGAAAGGLAFAAGLVTREGFVALAAGTALAWMAGRPEARRAQAAVAAVAVLALLLAMHRVPGFTPLRWLDSFGSSARSLQWSFDKAAAAWLLLLLALPRRAHAPALHNAVLLLGVAASVLGTALLSGIAQWAPGVPAGFGTWFAGNLMITALAEECFFRGLLQARLAAWLEPRSRHAHSWALGLVALLFGLVHAPWGLGFALGAVLAGFGYGLCWQRGGLAAAVLAHAVCNAALVLLTRSPLG